MSASPPNITHAPPPNPLNTTFITRSGSQLYLSSSPYVIAGPNIYWLGIDENDPPGSITYPSKARVLEIMATAFAMGANTIRSTSLGVSVGCAQCVMPSLGVVNEQALEVVDFAVWAARLYGMRLIVPLVDQYEYYHGGIYSFLQFNNLSIDDHTPFYNTSSPVYTTFQSYVGTILNHTSVYTNITLSQDPTILAWESGNELGGWGGNQAPVDWTAAIAQYIKGTLGAKQLFIDGSYGINKDALDIPEVDMYSNHFYPPYDSRLLSDAALTSSHNKAYFAGEFDWVDKESSPRMWSLVAVPALLALAIWPLPSRWFPWPIRKRKWLCCFGARSGRKKDGSSGLSLVGQSEETVLQSAKPAALPKRPKFEREDTDTRWRLFEESPRGYATPVYSPAGLPIVSPTITSTSLPSSPDPKLIAQRCRSDVFLFRKWHLALLILFILTPTAAILLHFFLPSTVSSFVNDLSATPTIAGGLYWSLFGRTDDCNGYIQHNDGYELTYPGTGAFMMDRVGQLTSWERSVSGKGVSLWGMDTLPYVQCLQNVTLPAMVTGTTANGGG